MLKFQSLLTATVVCGALFFGAVDSGFAADAGRKTLHGHVPGVVAHLQSMGRLPAKTSLNLAIGLPLRNGAALDVLLKDLYDPASPNYHQYLTLKQFTEQFGPTEQDYQAVKDFARTNGLTVTTTYGNRLVLEVAGQVANIERAFRVTMRTYQHPTENRLFYAPDVEPSLASDMQITHIEGLDNYTLPHPKFKQHPRSQMVKATPRGSGPSGELWGNDYRDAYVPGTTLTGAGQNIGLFEFETYYPVDITNYWVNALRQPAATTPNVVLVSVDGGTTQNSEGDNGEECSIDIEMCMAMAPGISGVYVFATGSSQDALLEAMVTYTNINQFSCSWGTSTSADSTAETLFKEMQAQGQSFYNASGDKGAYVGAVEWPSDSPSITQVGGSSLVDGSAPSYAWVSETAWDDDSGPTVSHGNAASSSGGISTYYTIPYWQTNLSYINSTGTNGASTTYRNFPDVSMNAEEDNEVYMDDGEEEGGWGGTSFAAPLWAGLTALMNQQSKMNGGAPVGFLNPALYALAQQSNGYTTYFHDITSGNDTWRSSPNLFYAVPGYDLVCGIGTPVGDNLINALAAPSDSLIITPLTGFTASGPAGGPFSGTPQNFILTNSSVSSLNWSLINTSSWLNLSPVGGSLAAGRQTNVTANLTAVGTNLTVGAYAASVFFTNQTTHVAQLRQFTFQVLTPLAVLPATGFTSSGPPGGPFSVTSQNFLLTNLGTASLKWGVVNTSAWLNATSAGGTLAPAGQTTLTVSLTSAANSLAAGIYAANVLVTNQNGGSVSVPFTLQAGQPLVQNGGFETGDFTSWTETGTTTYMGVSSTATYVHSGTYGAQLGPDGALSYLSQNLVTTPGLTYLLSCWLVNPKGETPNQFLVQWNGSTIYNVTNITTTTWNNLQFLVTATNTITPLQFGFRNDPDYFGFDDVTVTPVAPITFKSTVKAVNSFQLVLNTTTGIVYQVQYKTNLLQNNWINLGNPITATGTTLTVSDTNAVSSSPQRFYRLQISP